MAARFKSLFVILLVVHVVLTQNSPASKKKSTITTLVEDLMTNYDSRFRPVLRENQSVQLNMSFNINMLRQFDDVKGEISFLATFSFTWWEKRLTWNESQYERISELVLPIDTIWIPEVMMPTSINPENQPGRGAKTVRIDSSGKCEMTSIDLLKAYCPADVQKYPYDTQECHLDILPTGYKNNELQLGKPAKDMPMGSDNSEWEISEITSQAHLGIYQIAIELKRKSTYAVFTMSIPVLLLGSINPFVFILPPESGERISFAITTFLSFTVYMGIFTDHMPKGSTPMASIIYFIFIMLVYSVAILICTIFSLLLHTKEGKKSVPRKIQQIVNFMTFSPRHKCKKSLVSDSQTIVCVQAADLENAEPTRGKNECKINEPRVTNEDEKHDGKESEISWTQVGNLFDTCMFIIFGIWIFAMLLLFYVF